MLNEITELPAGFLEADHKDIAKLLKSPTLIHLQGDIKQPLFISTLLHGNEYSGLIALQGLLKKYQSLNLPRSLSIFIGNVAAAEKDVRHLPNQPDYNRIWPGTEHKECKETRMMKKVVEIMKDHQPFASIDLHNNTGRNPHYGCVNRLSPQYLQLARLFSHTVVYFTTPKGVQSEAFAKICPAVTLECGKVGELDGIEHASRFIETTMQLEHLPDHVPSDIDLFHTVARVTICDDVDFSFDGSGDLTLDGSIELYNFKEIPEGTKFAHLNNSNNATFEAWDDHGKNIYDDFFSLNENDIVLKKPMMPSMFTKNKEVIRQDCLCYLMERLRLD
ncbi:MAG: succinylglutamate desuccinylase/aspartoacylase family protein [Gammaproteobacteria bacterium]|nr:succinylglutamate desuccinylase/aspartoacylase family protein [Gammaproteobacteria bacterium]